TTASHFNTLDSPHLTPNPRWRSGARPSMLVRKTGKNCSSGRPGTGAADESMHAAWGSDATVMRSRPTQPSRRRLVFCHSFPARIHYMPTRKHSLAKTPKKRAPVKSREVLKRGWQDYEAHG